MKHKLLLIAALMSSLTVGAVCPDFMDLNSPYVTAFTGHTDNPFDRSGVVDGRHTLITTQGTDPNTGGALNLLPPGEDRVIKLGNEQIGAEAEALTYHFTVDIDNAVLLLKFAVVLEDPFHSPIGQPRFVVRVMDSRGHLTEECAKYDVYAHAGIPGFQSEISYSAIIRWRDWTDVGLDLSRYIGQTVQLQFITYDCAYKGHFGYAYFTASCMSNQLRLTNCQTPFEVSAPDNFASYLWDNGDQTRTTTRTNAGSMWCKVTSATGCQFTLSGYVTTSPVSTPSFIQATIYEGESYNENYFSLPPQDPGVYTYYNTIINSAACDNFQTTELELTVIQRYNHIKAAICRGEDYLENGFHIIQPALGVRRDTVKAGNIAGRDVYNILELTVSMSFAMPNIIEGDVSPCSGELTTYAFAGSETLTRFEWEFPENTVVPRGRYSSQVTLYFTDDTPGQIILRGANGCGTGSASLSLYPHQTYNIQFNEHICQGNVYNNYGFNLGIQDSPGYFVYEKHLVSSLGCDSSVVLALNVFPNPVVRIEPEDLVLCNPGDEITLLAVAGDMEWEEDEVDNPENNPFVFIYDCELNYRWNTGETTASITKRPTETAIYTVTVSTENGCPVMASQQVVVNTNVPVILHDTICSGETYTGYGFSETETGSYATTIHRNDCDVPVTVNLFVRPPVIEKITGVVCEGERYLQHGFDIQFYQAGIFRNTLHFWSHTGCDSTLILEITVNPSPEITMHDIVCQNEPYNKKGFNLPAQTIAGEFTYTRNSITPQNCDSTIILKLLVTPAYTNIISDEIQSNGAYNKYNFNFPKVTQDTTATKNLTSVEGCDSTVILNLKLLCETKDTVIYHIICEGEVYNFGGNNLDITGVYYDTIAVSTGCDSIVILDLTVHLPDTIPLYDTIYIGNAYNDFGFSIPVQQSKGSVLDTIFSRNQYGCDSLVILYLEVDCPAIDTTLNVLVCHNDFYFFKGGYLNESGIYRDTILLPSGCDSVIILNLTVHQPDTILLYDTIHIGNAYNDLGFSIPVQQSKGSVSDTIFSRNQYGCDSLVILYLDVICPLLVNTSFYETVCQGESYSGHGFTLPSQNVSGSYIHRRQLTDMYGCDSLVTLYLTVKPLYEKTFTARIPVNGPYNGNGFFIEPHPEPGFFTYEHRLNDSFGCDSVVTLRLTVYAEIIPDEYFSPNNDGVRDVWNIKYIEYFEVITVEIYDRFGKKLVQYTGEFIPWDGTYLGNAMPSGDYWYIITLKEKAKPYAGHFTLIRQ